MPGESPLNMMRPDRQQVRRREAVPRRRLGPLLAAAAVVVVLALGWCWLWYYAASVADRTLAGWVEREAAAGRVYSCGRQSVGGFPFRIEARCDTAAAEVKTSQPPFAANAKAVTFAAQVYQPTRLVGDITGPLTVAELGQPPGFVANWSLARISVRGIPPEPDSLAVTFDRPRLARAGDTDGAPLFAADQAELHSRIIEGSARHNPVIETLVHFTAATAPTLHPLLADPLGGDIDVVLRGLPDFSPKPWAQRFREMQAAGGSIEIKSLRIERSDAIVVGTGTLTVNEHGKLDGLISVAVVGIEHIVPLLGLDRLIGHGIDRLSGSGGQPGQGLGALDRLMPGLSVVVRQGANASVIENLKKMGQPTEIDKKPAVLLPLHFSDGTAYLGLIPLGDVPPLF